jgi:FkbM family methyltransferase
MRYLNNVVLAKQYGSIPDSKKSGVVFESIVKSIYETVLKGGSWAIDCGANKGQHTFNIAKCCEKVIAFEPIPELCKRLVERAVIAGYQHKIIFLELGVSNQKGLLDFYQDVDAPALSSFKPQLSDRKFKPLKIITVTLDDIVSYPVDFIKLDIEGAEFDALRGSIGLLRKYRPVVVFEFGRSVTANRFGYSDRDFFDFFESISYSVCDVFGTKLSSENWSNHIWMPWYVCAWPNERPISLLRTAIRSIMPEITFDGFQ